MTNLKNTGTSKGNRASSSSPANLRTQNAFELFNKVFETYTPDEVFVAFNGGKDCTVVLHLLHRFLKMNEAFKDCTIPVLYIQPKSPFPEIEEFVHRCSQSYPVALLEQQGPIKIALEKVLEMKPNFKVVLMGVRRTDPKGQDMKSMQDTDPGWPPLLRINPILDWTCQDVWGYILENEVPYCSLYDEGYTSLGDTTNTFKNEHLKTSDSVTGEVTYRPAYELADDALERQGRVF